MTTLTERLENLRTLLNQEYQSQEPSQNYIDDLLLSIKFCEKQLKRNGGKGYELVEAE